ncbi:MAG TPA: histidine triad nucleotide-binding protein [Burkholderiales bacterium]
MENCIFCKIVRGEIPSKKVYEDDEVLAFHDINPLAPVHFMVIPKQHVDSLAHVSGAHNDVLGKIMVLAPKIAKEQGCKDGFRTIINTGRVARQDVFHLHIHIIGGPEVLPPMLYRSKTA